MTEITVDALIRRAVRAWWVDGLWDFAVAGMMALLAGWIYILVRFIAFPAWTWPVIPSETTNPFQAQLTLWFLAILPVGAAYAWATFRLVQGLKSRWLASRQGDVRHPFWMKLSPKVLVGYSFTCLAVFILASALALAFTGGPHWFSAIVIAAPAAMLVSLGIVYTLPRYWIAGVVGLLACLALDILATTPANYQLGPTGFLRRFTPIRQSCAAAPGLGRDISGQRIDRPGGCAAQVPGRALVMSEESPGVESEYTAIIALDRMVHEPARLAILAVLAGCESADFQFLLSATGVK